MTTTDPAVTTALANPYWDAVRDLVNPTGFLRGTPEDALQQALNRPEYVNRYSWTITDPDTVAFVAEHARGRLVDPMAGTGYWAWLLTQAGVDVTAYDLHPPAVDSTANEWHRNASTYVSVGVADAKDAVVRSASRTLLLSWPPYGYDACPILDAYRGDRVIYIGEDWGGCCGDDGLFEALDRDWIKVAKHVPVRWMGIYDIAAVYDRRD